MKLVAFILFATIAVATCWSCEDNEFKCLETGACIPQALVCDGKADCYGRTDEVDCQQECPGFQCNIGNCIPAGWKCDGEEDCKDGEDEIDCQTTPCGGFTCDDGSCIPSIWKCDGDRDCSKGEDEENCPTTLPPPSTPCSGFTCENGKCIPNAYVCDGENDCGDDSDETVFVCPCASDEIRCSTPPGAEKPGACIPPELICDDDEICDCPFCDDEANCTKSVNIHDPRDRRGRQEHIIATKPRHLLKYQQNKKEK